MSPGQSTVQEQESVVVTATRRSRIQMRPPARDIQTGATADSLGTSASLAVFFPQQIIRYHGPKLGSRIDQKSGKA